MGRHSREDRASGPPLLLRHGGMRSAYLYGAFAEHGAAIWSPDVSAVGGAETDRRDFGWICGIPPGGTTWDSCERFYVAAGIAAEGRGRSQSRREL